MAPLTAAFRELRKLGYFARQNWKCCQSCGCAEVPDDKADAYVFYHRQDTEHMATTGRCYLAWGGDGHKIAAVLTKHGLRVDWNGNPNVRIAVITDEELFAKYESKQHWHRQNTAVSATLQ